MLSSASLRNGLVLIAFLVAACGNEERPIDLGYQDASVIDAGPYRGHFCDLPGSVLHTPTGTFVLAGGPPTPDLTWLKIPEGFCVHYYGHVPDARQIRFAPGGELFVSSPTTPTTGGGPGGQAAILILPDDDRDGVADKNIPFLNNLPSTQGLTFFGGYLYYQDGTTIKRVPYQRGQRSTMDSGEVIADITAYQSSGHWPKNLDSADDGTLYVTNGGDQFETCDQSRPFHGGVLRLDSSGGTPVMKGCRNPIALRCQRGHNQCYVAELALDYSGMDGGREKVVPVRDGDDWGYPCCATKGIPYPTVSPQPDCSKITTEDNAFVIGETPFGIDFDRGSWDAPFTNNMFVALHGYFGTWQGASVVAIPTDPATGAPMKSSDLPGQNPTGQINFATGWDDGLHDHGRPAALAMAPDGRLFLANDVDGDIVWFAPLTQTANDDGGTDGGDDGPPSTDAGDAGPRPDSAGSD